MRCALPTCRLWSDKCGAAAIELALVAPILATMIIGVVDLSNAFSRKLALEQGAQRAIEKIMQTTGTSTVQGTLKDEAICQVNGVDANGTCNTSPITDSDVTVTWRLECVDAGGTRTSQSSTNSTTYDGFTCASGTVREVRYIEIELTDKYAPLFPIHYFGNNSDGTYHISAKAGVRTS